MDTHESKELRFSNKQILVVGEGDFSFSLSLAKAFGSATNFTATSLDIRENLGRNYNNGKENVVELERLGCTVVRGVNVHSITSDNRLARYDVILFYCPHAGKLHGVVGGFMKSAKEMMKEEDVGEFHIIHITMHPFNKWDIKTLAEEEGLRFINQMKFDKWAFPSYSNKNGNGSNCDNSFPIGSAVVTFIFKK
ncbi:hypothetical protein CARUB_v10003134mg [Capsella rubella]|uniref:25S rRNA (uridine-N(3))-methyltransferase BMT5-like domain-containing protein n=1 Tax=Capsella rubella TaxID=81985 RepID=R0FJA6_9BRAS|nr:uncharacterized protein At4g26485 [Capsella rubella]EOA22482.1 hypothetical protein CARUB_v10003134mg [Capsella rubella]